MGLGQMTAQAQTRFGFAILVVLAVMLTFS
jgi:hypothetical protein